MKKLTRFRHDEVVEFHNCIKNTVSLDIRKYSIKSRLVDNTPQYHYFKWIDENCEDLVFYNSFINPGVLYFKSESDAMAFKLAWYN